MVTYHKWQFKVKGGDLLYTIKKKKVDDGNPKEYLITVENSQSVYHYTEAEINSMFGLNEWTAIFKTKIYELWE